MVGYASHATREYFQQVMPFKPGVEFRSNWKIEDMLPPPEKRLRV